MPCRKADHNHEWPSNGTLTILPCETICYLCDSVKEYKPASALRKHVQTHIKNDKLPLSLLRSASGRPRLSTRGFIPHSQTAVVQPPTAEQEPHEPDSTPDSSSQMVVQGTPLEQPAQLSSDTFLGAGFFARTAPGCYAHSDTTATLTKHLHESLLDTPHSPTLPPATPASSIAYISMLRGDQPSTTDASRHGAPPNELGFNSVAKSRMRSAAVEPLHDYRESHAPDRCLNDLTKRYAACSRTDVRSGPAHYIDLMEYDCDGDFPRVLQWEKRASSQRLTISFTDHERPYLSPKTYIYDNLINEQLLDPRIFEGGWAKDFGIIISAANQYRITDTQEHKAIEKGLVCLDVCFGMLRVILRNFEPNHTYSGEQNLKKSYLRDFISILFDTTVATSNSGHNEQYLDIFYGTLILCMIRFVLFLSFRYSRDDYIPVGRQANHDPTFLNGRNSQLYLPMLYALANCRQTFHGGNIHVLRASVAIRSGTRYIPMGDMHTEASEFIDFYSRDCAALQSCLSALGRARDRAARVNHDIN